MAEPIPWKLVVHGGAGVIEPRLLSEAKERAIRSALHAALEAGAAVLSSGGGALDAVERAAKVLENDPHFNAGRGSVFTYQGTIEMDAAIMDGGSRAAGAVAGVSATKNPVSLARRIMEDSRHVLLSREGADQFSREQGLEQAPPEYFATAERREALEIMRSQGDDYFDEELKYGTVGAVAVDVRGHVAAATSTGGITGKRWARIGDSPMIGAGTYADDRAAAISCTGSGEYFIRAGVAHEICARMRMLGEGVRKAADEAIADVGLLGGTGGVIAVTPQGDATWAFNTIGMYRGIASAEGLRVAIFADE
jgi:beta-aspartyl-peptidase (threonine type)